MNLRQVQTVSSLTEVHQVLVTLQQCSQPTSPRHEQEKSRLLETLDRRKGTWNANHPRRRLLDALHGFLKYQERQSTELSRLRGLYKNVPKSQKTLLEHHLSYSSKFDQVQAKLIVNQALCDQIVGNALHFYGIEIEELQKHIRDTEASGHLADKVSVSQALKHIVRDWTDEGDHERNSTFRCMLGTLTQLFPDRLNEEQDAIKILLPGAGLGRLGHEINRLGGFEVTTNEYSMFMNVLYRFIETHHVKNGKSFHPFIDGWSHHATDADMHRSLQFPDVEVDPRGVLLMEGDFTTIYRKDYGTFDIVLTYFFIDTARNLMNYLDNIKGVLKPGGYWINLGPLLYGTAPLVQLSLEDVLKISEAMGFEFSDTDEQYGPLTFEESTVRSMEAVYGFDDKALTKNAYNAQFWVARKL
ncbi:hypothetical protein HIM_03754 [Hirsutella minnesotensis 3608]|uniref:Uncharacterized protein n=1 Tax=Hirsutella minnesotensis 3608 TaxID=1043627 RepID=A0A0F8A2A1_9HYPO|nr:hypothetical protein HIM_12645 [Hirsutella minnesotensis 3608]KJZ76877.1 hypothetical protein HIM_03754 [Hirsutella minnesotensis 3608]